MPVGYERPRASSAFLDDSSRGGWSAASEPVWAVVCGLPSYERKRRLLVVLRGFIDESEDQHTLVLGGYVAPADEWAKFSDRWQAALDMAPRIKVWKTKDAMASPPSGEFRGWSRELVEERSRLLYSIIDDHVSFAVTVAIPKAIFSQYMKQPFFHKAAADPYYTALSEMIGGLARYQLKIGMPEKVHFIFDESKTKQGKLLAIWDRLMRNAPADIKAMVGSTPVFASDSCFRPLQAADMEAWWLRRRWYEKLTGAPRLEYPWVPEPIPEVCTEYDEALIERHFRRLLDGHLDVWLGRFFDA